MVYVATLTLINNLENNMNKTQTLVTTALAALIAMGAMTSQTAVAEEHKDMEKCYGVVKAGKNDCKTMSSACAGHSTTDAQPDAFIAVPKGTCERIAGGSLVAPAAN
jgi:uncharacterized membrane protein